MSFTENIKLFATKVKDFRGSSLSEEATKMSLIVPFFQIMGYDVFNPSEFCPEYTADVGIKKGEKVDYAILINNKPTILIEAKPINSKLEKHSSQLFRYFVTTSAKFAILTNGVVYKFYTDLEETNKMDKTPFMELNLLNLTDNDILQLSKFQKNSLDVSEIIDTASIMKYSMAFKKYIEQQLINPTDEFVKLFLQPIYKGAKTQNIIEKFRPILKSSLNEFITDTVNNKIKFALENNGYSEYSTSVTDDNEWESLTIIKDILKNTIDIKLITCKHTESYTAILIQNNPRKWICRLNFSSNQKSISIPDSNKKEHKYILDSISNIYDYSEELITVTKRYIEPVLKKDTPLLRTKWGDYEMPENYSVQLAYGPRNDLNKV